MVSRRKIRGLAVQRMREPILQDDRYYISLRFGATKEERVLDTFEEVLGFLYREGEVWLSPEDLYRLVTAMKDGPVQAFFKGELELAIIPPRRFAELFWSGFSGKSKARYASRRS